MRIPQANDVNKVMKVAELVSDGVNCNELLSLKLRIDKRQAGYYSEAAEMLGLVVCTHGQILPTTRGNLLGTLKPDEKKYYMTIYILETDVFRELNSFLLNNEALDDDAILKLLDYDTNLSQSTKVRRASTLKAWIHWVST